MNDNLKISGHIFWKLTGKDGSIEHGNIPNVITNYGKQWFASVIAGSTNNSLWLGAGSSIGPTGTVSASDTSLFSEISSIGYGYSRQLATKMAVNNTIQYIATLDNITSPTPVKEVGLFSSSTVGGSYLVAHQIIGNFNLGPTYAGLQITWIISLN